MKAKDISGQAPGGKREKLASAIPLDTPFVVQIFPIYACNFKCSYCIFSVDKKERGFISDKVLMDLDLFKRAVDDMTRFPSKIKVLRFVGIGEPILHKNLAEMIEYSVSKNVANTVELLTNASLLNKENTDAIIKAGLNRLVVSVQGTSAEKYKDVCDTDINFNEFLENLKYFYENRAQAKVYIKIVDTAIDGEEDEKRFHEIFGNVCDTMAIEHTVPIHEGIDYNKVLDEKKDEVTQFGLPVKEVKVCPQPFFTMQINPDGKVVPCFSFEYPEIIGDCNDTPVDEIWNGKKYNDFRLRMLNGSEKASAVCRDCNIIKYRIFPEDDLSDDAERLRKFYE